jgi:hypothetical protein
MLPRINRELLQQSLYRFPQILQIFDNSSLIHFTLTKLKNYKTKTPQQEKLHDPEIQIFYSCTTCKSVMQTSSINNTDFATTTTQQKLKPIQPNKLQQKQRQQNNLTKKNV